MENKQCYLDNYSSRVAKIASVISLGLSALTVGLALLYGRRLELENHVLTQTVDNLSAKVDYLYKSSTSTEQLKMAKRDVDAMSSQPETLLNQLSIADLIGLRGPPGQNGRDGKDGKDGRDGRDCNDDHDHSLLTQVLQEMRSQSQDSSEQLKQVAELIHIMNDTLKRDNHQQGFSNISGENYIRWGKTTCPTSSQLIYKGFVGGQYYDHTGGASSRVCLPLDPEWSTYDTASNSDGNFIYGTEYEVNSGGPTGIFPGQLDDENVPCAACYSPGRVSMLMLPAKRNCPDTTWTKEYEGYLMAEKYTHKASAAYVCVDANPEFINGMKANKNGATLHFVQASCEYTGHCPPYINFAEITCVVCTR